MRISAVTSVLALSLDLFAHPALCQRELLTIGNRNTDGRISLRAEAPQGKAIFFEASNVLRQSFPQQ